MDGILKMDTSKFRFFLLAVLFGIFLTIPAQNSALAGEFWKSIAIVNNLASATGPEGAGKRSVNLDVRFEVNSAKLTTQARRQLDALGEALKSDRLAGYRFAINGHTDASGAAAYNKTLSQQRARTVKSYLVDIHRIDPAHLSAVGWGEERPINAFDPRSAENRRVEIVNLTLMTKSAMPAPTSPDKMKSDQNRVKGFKTIY